MFKLVVLIEGQDDLLRFESDWPKFLALANKIGLNKSHSSIQAYGEWLEDGKLFPYIGRIRK